MYKLIIIFIVVSFSSCTSKENKYQAVADKIIENLKTQRYFKMGIKNDTIIDINKDGIKDTIEFKPRFNSYNVNDTIYYSLNEYGWTVLEEIDDKFYIYDVTYTNSEEDTYISAAVFEILEDFRIKQVIEFKNTNSFYITNNDSITIKDLESKYLTKENLLECKPTNRKLVESNSYFFGFNGNSTEDSKWSNQIEGEVVLRLDTIICMAIYTGNRSPFSTTYMRLHSADTNRFKELNKELSDWKRMSQMKAYYDNGILVIYEHGWEDIDEPYRLFVVDLNNNEKVEIVHYYKYDYSIERVAYFDPKKFTFEEDSY